MPGSETVEKGRRVIVLEATWETKDKLREWAQAAGFDLGWSHSGWPQSSYRFHFHVTVAASKNALAMDIGSRSIDPLTLTASGFGTLGDGSRTPVLLLEQSEKLTAIRDFVISEGVEPTDPDFAPHITLSYKWNGAPELANLPLPPIPLVFDRIIVSELRETASVNDAASAALAATDIVVCDAAVVVAGTRRTGDGYLVAEARCARTGIQEYLGAEVGKPDMATVRVYRPADEVFSQSALASYAFRPVTVGHPAAGVTADNWKREAVGTTGGEIARDGGFVRVPLVLMDAAAIAVVEGGTREISMGYDCRLEWTAGVTPEGEAYDAIQRGLRMNHLAIVPQGRAGAACRVGDSVTPREGATQPENDNMKTLVIDGVSHKVEDATADLIAKMQADAKTAAEALTAAEKARDAAIGERDALKSKIPTADGIDALVAERAKLIADAKRLAPDVDPAGKSSDALRAAVVKAKLGDGAVTNRSADYVTAAFDTLAASNTNTDPAADAIRTGATGAATDAGVTARDKCLAEQANAWKH